MCPIAMFCIIMWTHADIVPRVLVPYDTHEDCVSVLKWRAEMRPTPTGSIGKATWVYYACQSRDWHLEK